MPAISGSAATGEQTTHAGALKLLASLFFVWGFITVINNTLLPHLRSVFQLNYVETTLIESVWFIAYFVAPRSPQMLPGDEWSMPMAIPMFGLGLPELGPYYFSVRVDGREMDRASFRLMPPAPAQVADTPDGPGAASGGDQLLGGPPL